MKTIQTIIDEILNDKNTREEAKQIMGNSNYLENEVESLSNNGDEVYDENYDIITEVYNSILNQFINSQYSTFDVWSPIFTRELIEELKKLGYEVSEYHIANTGSIYFNVNDYKVRIADHSTCYECDLAIGGDDGENYDNALNYITSKINVNQFNNN